jgi:hypothetical protein
LFFPSRHPLLDSSLFSSEDLEGDRLPDLDPPDNFLDGLEASPIDDRLGNDLFTAPPDTNLLEDPLEPCLLDNDLLDEYGDLLDLLDLLGELLDDLLDLDLLGELLGDFLALDLLDELLLLDLLNSNPGAVPLDVLPAGDPLEDEPLDSLLDILSANPGEAANPGMMP